MHNGNITEILWKNSLENKVRSYGYDYDNLNRLLKAESIKGENEVLNAHNEEVTGYDKNGNILGIIRSGSQDLSSNPVWIDNLVYDYQTNSNKLLSVTDTTTEPKGFKDGNSSGNDYNYDSNDNLVQDLNKGITKITYNDLNLPTELLWNASKKINYLYDASGVKLRKVVIDGTQITTTDYSGGFQYKKNGSNEPIELQFFPTAEGYVNVTENNTFNYVYNYTDHLGNVRLSYQKDTNGLKILEENNYYPYGLKHSGYNNTNLANSNYNYKYNGKELQTDLDINLYDYGARNYDPAIGRWMNIDPLAEKMRRHSPYNYAFNNPVYFIDPDGMAPEGGSDNEDPNCGTCRRKESAAQKTYRLYYQEKAELANALTGGGLSSEKSDKEVDAYSLFYQFAWGTGKSERNFDENSKMGKEFLKIDEIKNGIEKLVDDNINSGNIIRDVSRNNPKKFNTGSSWLDDKIYMADALSTIVSNPTSTFHGSFNASAKITNVDHGYFIDTYTINISSTDYMGATSATRAKPVNGKYTGEAVIPNNYYGPNGYMRTIKVNYNLTTTVTRPAIGRQISNFMK
ncbi:RHS repeat-associated core domain-containing protein [Chishuiella changwenlii]|uniref:RHS repeat domain-containing protein n=1 Tax=Chishuiella changwenlii TaxID=1434701 RepID=UPI002FD9B52E